VGEALAIELEELLRLAARIVEPDALDDAAGEGRPALDHHDAEEGTLLRADTSQTDCDHRYLLERCLPAALLHHLLQRAHSLPHGGLAAATFAESQRGKDSVERLEAVNWYVNKRVHFVDDSVRWGRADVWSAANQTLNAGKGDCEDYAIAKLAMLRRAGIADKDLYLVILKDTVRRADHAVLVVRAAGHMYLLDNGTDEVLDTETVHDYRPIFTFASNATFTHGYRVHQAPVNLASADIAPPTPAADTSDGSDDQRSRKASLLAFNIGLSK